MPGDRPADRREGHGSSVAAFVSAVDPLSAANLFVSLDGVVEDPADWHFLYFNDELGAVVGAADTLLLGRKT